MFLFAGAKLLRTGYQNRVQTFGPGAVRTSPAPGTTSSPAAALSSRAKCEGKHLNTNVISSLTLPSSGNPVSSIPQSVTYTITSPCPSLVPDVNITLVYLDCLAKTYIYYAHLIYPTQSCLDDLDPMSPISGQVIYPLALRAPPPPAPG